MASGSTKAVYAAIGANSVIMVTKFGAFAVTGSGAMLSEGIHSLADVMNQSLLAMGIKKAQRAPTPDHPYGYGQDSFIWALISAVGIFFLGCGVTLYHGIHSLLHPEGVVLQDIEIAGGVLLFSLLLESWTLWIAYKEVRRAAQELGVSFGEYLRRGPDPMAVAVLLEDAAAVIGVILASICIGLFVLTGNPVWDAVASIIIALLLGMVAVFLVIKNRESLLSQSVAPQQQQQILDLLEADPAVESVHDVKATVLGADSFRFKAEIDFDGTAIAAHWLEQQDLDELFEKASADKASFHTFLLQYGEVMCTALGDEIDRIEEKIRAKVPKAKHVDIEVD
jgi:zinc transporter 9